VSEDADSTRATEAGLSNRDELARRIPELRSIPGFPYGSDEDILAMSLPPYYTACPNPFIGDWLKETAPDGGEPQYQDPGPYAADVSVSKTHPIYKAHSFPTKVPHEAIVRYILHYTRPGDLVLDGFCGTGMTGMAAQACGSPGPELGRRIELEMGKVKWGPRRAVLQDLSPWATFIAAGVNLPIDAAAFDRRSEEILNRFDQEWGWMYETSHLDGKRSPIDYTVWSEVLTCPHCGGEVIFYDAAFDGQSGKVQDQFHCAHCGARVSKGTLEHRRIPVRTLGGDIVERIEFRPVRIHYRVGKTRYDKAPDDVDLDVLRRVARATVPWFPMAAMPVPSLWHGYNFKPRGLTHLHHLFGDRALAALAILWDWCSSEEDPSLRLALLFWAEQAIWGLSWMNRYRPEGYSQVSQYQSGVYYFPALQSECSVRYNLGGKRDALVKTWGRSPAESGRVMISTGSSTALDLPDASVDYIFVDPPFGLNIPYSDLALMVELWHGVVSNSHEEAVVHRVRGRDLDEYQHLLYECFVESFRVLKPGRWITVEFNNSSNAVWMALQEALLRAGFMVADTRILDKEQGSWIQVRRPNAVKRDIVISAYRPTAELEARMSLVAGSEEGAWEFVREHLRHLPVLQDSKAGGRLTRERQADRLYDRMVAYHIHREATIPMTAGEFYAGLEQRFPVRDNMYFLPQQIEPYEQQRMNRKDLQQTELFITSEASAVQWLRQLLRAQPRSFAEIQPPFFRELQAGLPDWEDLPDLRPLLEDSFLQDDQGRWYIPDPKKATDLEKLRTRGLLREFQAYVEKKGKLEKFRSEAVRAGFKDAWAKQDFQLIVSVGNRLPEDVFTEDQSLLYYLDNARRRTGK
jgi:DNA modification methylase